MLRLAASLGACTLALLVLAAGAGGSTRLRLLAEWRQLRHHDDQHGDAGRGLVGDGDLPEEGQAVGQCHRPHVVRRHQRPVRRHRRLCAQPQLDSDAGQLPAKSVRPICPQPATFPIAIQRVDSCNGGANVTYRLRATRGTFSANVKFWKPALVVSFHAD